MTKGPPAGSANTMQELVRAAQDRLVYRQVGSVRAEEATLRCLQNRSGETVESSDRHVAALRSLMEDMSMPIWIDVDRQRC